MALLLSKNTTQINVKGTDIELSSVYVRIVFICNLDGSLTVTYKTYQNADAYLAGKEISTDVINMTYNYVILPTETQSLDIALLYMQNEFTQLGYNAIIV
jgi:hypothetical protein